jgi:hypothetical protein
VQRHLIDLSELRACITSGLAYLDIDLSELSEVTYQRRLVASTV